MTFRTAILTVSDRCSKGEAIDKSGPALTSYLNQNGGFNVVATRIVPDSIPEIQNAVIEFCQQADLVLTTGGTGFGVRDFTPEAIKPILTKEASGITIAMMTNSLRKTHLASLSRPICGVRHHSLILTLPGSVKGSIENLESVMNVLGHALELIKGERNAGEAMHKKISGDGHPTGCACHAHDDLPVLDSKLKSDDPTQGITKRSRNSTFPMIEFEDAIKIVAKNTSATTIEMRSITKRLDGYIVAEDIYGKEAVPSYRASVVDGYAMIANDGPGIYPVTGTSKAGDAESGSLKSGEIVRITTGAPVPNGCTAVIMVEDTLIVSTVDNGTEEKEIEIKTVPVDSQFIREIGSDVAQGDLVLSKGQLITSIGGEVGILASVGVSEIPVYRKPIVGVMSTGNEVVPLNHPGPLKPGMIRDANRPSLISVISQAGYEIVDFGIVNDDQITLASKMKEGLEKVDVLITTGGVSMGEHDYLKPVIERNLGGTIQFGRVKLKPGKPTTFATIPVGPDKPPKCVFALPGNPVSALVTYYLFVLPALKKLSGQKEIEEQLFPVIIDFDIKLDPRPEFHRVILKLKNGEWHAASTGSQVSSRIASLVSANGLLRLPASDKNLTHLPAGSKVPAMLLK